MRKILVLLVFMGFCSTLAIGQFKQKTPNYRNFDKRWLHFGFLLGANVADFSTAYKVNMLDDYGYVSIRNRMQPGFHLGLIGMLKLGTPLVRLRFVPSFSFHERILEYKFPLENPDPNKQFDIKTERIGSTNLEFPLLFKFRTLRYNNFTAYIITGAQYVLDLQSKQNKNQVYSDPFIKLYRDDFQAQIGAGFDFFLTFFKFGIEFKLSHGFKNALYQDNTRLSNPIDKLYNRVWLLSFTFEG